MRSWGAGALVALGIAAAGTAAPAQPVQEVVWGRFLAPSPGRAEPIGSYTNGCLLGGVALPADGPGYQVIRLSRNRFYGHPVVIDYLKALGQRVAAAGLGTALVGDIAQPRGGPMPSGHRSHQTGLDADIWLRLDLPRLPPEARESLTPVVVVDQETLRVDPALFTPMQAELIRLAASDSRVARIFVHPAIKLALCGMRWPDRSWLQVVRPWHGHDSHFHVRLACPPGAAGCEAQDPPATGEGCGEELMAWLPDPLHPRRPSPPRPALPRVPPPMPAACQALLASGQ